MKKQERIRKISSAVNSYFSQGLTADKSVIDFLDTAYGLSNQTEISKFFEGGDDYSAVLDLLSYPPESIRIIIEEFIPAEGFRDEEIKNITQSFSGSQFKIFILFKDLKISLSNEDSILCYERFIKRLNLDLAFNYFENIQPVNNYEGITSIKALMRMKKFLLNEDNFPFFKDLIHNFHSSECNNETGLLYLIEQSASILKNTNKKPFEILSEKKHFFENAITEAEEFTQLLKTYSMEFIMLKRIQPPLISIDEAQSMISIINLLTSIVYREIIPPLLNVIVE